MHNSVPERYGVIEQTGSAITLNTRSSHWKVFGNLSATYCRLRGAKSTERRDQSPAWTAVQSGKMAPRSAVSTFRLVPSFGSQRILLFGPIHAGQWRDDGFAGIIPAGVISVGSFRCNGSGIDLSACRCFIMIDCMTFHSGGVNRTARPRRGVNHVYTIPLFGSKSICPRFLAINLPQMPTCADSWGTT